MATSYLLGSQMESMTFTDTGPHYQPAGTAHAVHVESATVTSHGLIGHALCGTPVRIWHEHSFEPEATDAHHRCAAMLSGQHAPDQAPHTEARTPPLFDRHRPIRSARGDGDVLGTDTPSGRRGHRHDRT